MDTSIQLPPSSYIEYLARLAQSNPTFKWLHQFFKHRTKKPDSETIILDVENDGFKRQQPDINTLMNQPATVQIRLVLFRYTDIWNLDRDSLDDICYALDLDPWMVWSHFDHQFSYQGNPFDDNEPQDRDGPLPRQFLSSSRYLHISTVLDERYESILATFTSRLGNSQTIVLFQQESPIPYLRHFPFWRQEDSIHRLPKHPQQSQDGRLLSSQHYLDEIHSWAGTPILATALGNPVEFIIPFFRLILGRITQSTDKGWAEAWFALNPGLKELWDKTLSAEEEFHYSALMQVKYLARALPNLRRFCAIHKTSPSSMVDNALMDLPSHHRRCGAAMGRDGRPSRTTRGDASFGRVTKVDQICR
ncbi:hypothetical protein B0H67DRAFT_261317 [Lasiosphaeris hirsuta]|uniref:Uncharacterized protein n=1 Tax=Lasiosphaeris hirsuta TaxID=260670 RepID=A0AA40AIA5_9PEZI|nr:hypothetical protein B0H67DRAFT_261317 [Lasiosphaeris hirsuta]